MTSRGLKRQRKAGAAAKHGEVEMDRLVPDAFPANRNLCWKTELSFFDAYPPSQTCILASEYIRFDPVTSVSDSSTAFDFVLHPAEEYVYDPANVRVGLDLAIVKRGGEPVKVYKKPDGATDSSRYDAVALVNMPLTSMFSRVEVLVNDVPINSNSGDHQYRAFLENTLNYTSGAKRTLLASSGHHSDVGKAHKTTFAENLGLGVRAQYTEKGQTWHLYGKLSHDLFNSSKVLPVGTKLGIRLYRNRSELLLMADGTMPDYEKKGYAVKVNRIYIEALRLKLCPETISYLETTLSRQVARIFLTRTEMRKFFVPGNALQWQATNLFTDQVPLRFFLGLVKTDAYQGSLTTNPLCFEHFDLSYLALKVDNSIVEPVLRPNWSGSAYVDAYVQTLKALRALDKPHEIDLPMDSFKAGPLAIFGFDLSSDKTDYSPCRRGVTSLELRFSTPTPDVGITGIVMGNFHGMVNIDQHRNVNVMDRIYNA